jgi:hypothetical protein
MLTHLGTFLFDLQLLGFWLKSQLSGLLVSSCWLFIIDFYNKILVSQ